MLERDLDFLTAELFTSRKRTCVYIRQRGEVESDSIRRNRNLIDFTLSSHPNHCIILPALGEQGSTRTASMTLKVDRVLLPKQDHEDAYNHIKPMVLASLQTSNVAIAFTGPSNSSKTYTLFGTNGVLESAARQIFRYSHEKQELYVIHYSSWEP